MKKIKLDKKLIFYLISLLTLWIFYILNRSILGFSLISDENFYFYQNIDHESKRVIFLSLVQFFSDKEIAKIAIVVMNIFALLISFLILLKINFKNYIATFFQLIYFTAVASYIFRDSLILLIFVSISYIIINNKSILETIRLKKIFNIYSLILILLLFIMFDFRPQYTAFLLLSWIGTIIAMRISNYTFFSIFFLLSFSIIFYGGIILTSFHIYGITLSDYLETRAIRHNIELTPITYSIGFIKHFFAPIPTSLLERILDTTILNIYGILDDIYRFFYKSFIYYILFYILFNFYWLKKVFREYRGEAFFFTIFSLLNALFYTFFSFGGGHERIKIFSTIFLVFLYSAIIHMKKKKKLSKKINCLKTKVYK